MVKENERKREKECNGMKAMGESQKKNPTGGSENWKRTRSCIRGTYG